MDCFSSHWSLYMKELEDPQPDGDSRFWSSEISKKSRPLPLKAPDEAEPDVNWKTESEAGTLAAGGSARGPFPFRRQRYLSAAFPLRQLVSPLPSLPLQPGGRRPALDRNQPARLHLRPSPCPRPSRGRRRPVHWSQHRGAPRLPRRAGGRAPREGVGAPVRVGTRRIPRSAGLAGLSERLMGSIRALRLNAMRVRWHRPPLYGLNATESRR